MSNHPSVCPHCGATMRENWHRLTPALILILVKFKRAVMKKGENRVHIQDDVEFSKVEYTNFQKLRYHGLVAKCFTSGEGSHRLKGFWLLTTRGNDFLHGRISLPCRVRTFRNHITAKDERLVSIGEAIKAVPFIETEESIDYDLHKDAIPMSEFMFDDKGQGLFI